MGRTARTVTVRATKDTPAYQRPAKRDTGKPSLYRPDHCGRVVEMGKQGKSFVQMAADLDVAPSTFHQWREAHAEFAEACTRAQAYAQAHMEGLGQAGIADKGFNAPHWAFMMKNRFRQDWGDKVTIEAGSSFADALAGALKHAQSANIPLIDVDAETIEAEES